MDECKGGPSPIHARSVANLLSLTTGLVSPQFHVHYDDTFQTLRNSVIMKSLWQDLAGFTSTQRNDRGTSTSTQSYIPNSEQLSVEPINNNQNADTQASVTGEHQNINIDTENDFENEGDIQSFDSFESLNERSIDDDVETTEPRVTRSGRVSKYPRRYDDYVSFLLETEQANDVNRAMAFAASSDPDILYLHEALAADDRVEFIKAMQREVDAHVENKIVKLSNDHRYHQIEKYCRQFGLCGENGILRHEKSQSGKLG
jgi:hypothetical protein